MLHWLKDLDRLKYCVFGLSLILILDMGSVNMFTSHHICVLEQAARLVVNNVDNSEPRCYLCSL